MAALSRVANQGLFNSINRLLLNVIDWALCHFWDRKKMRRYYELIKTLMLRTANVAVTVVFELGEMDEIICEQQ